MRRTLVSLGIVALFGVATGCSHSPTPEGEAPKAPFASAVIAPVAGNKCSGTIAFTQQGTRVRVVADLSGLVPGRKHGIHILEAFSCGSTLDAETVGNHFDPGNDEHGVPPDNSRHAGDLGNAVADERGRAHYELTITNFSVSEKRAVVGRAVVVHSGMDSGSQPAGNAGTAIGCGVIQAR